VLRFNAFWDDKTYLGERRYFILNYFLSDNTLELLEMLRRNSGHDPFPSFVRRQRVPRDGSSLYLFICILISSFFFFFKVQFFIQIKNLKNINQMILQWEKYFILYYSSIFFILKTLNIFGKNFLIYDCDEFTKYWTSENLGMNFLFINSINFKGEREFTPIPVYKNPDEEKELREIPPYLGFGSELDELATCFHVKPFLILYFYY
jgi:hypothetical protein